MRSVDNARAHRLGRLALVLLASTSGACVITEPPPPMAPDPEQVARAEAGPAPEWVRVGTSLEGRAIESATFGAGPTTVLLLAGIHGNEEAGTPLLEELAERLAADGAALPWMRGKRVVVLPALNPDGLAANRRHNADGVDLNRNFPARNFSGSRRRGDEPLSEPESRALHDLVLELRPHHVLTFHMPVGVIDHDGPAAELAQLASDACGLPVQKLGSRPGSLGSWLGVDLGIPTLTVELPASDHGITRAEAWERYGALLRAAIAYGG